MMYETQLCNQTTIVMMAANLLKRIARRPLNRNHDMNERARGLPRDPIAATRFTSAAAERELHNSEALNPAETLPTPESSRCLKFPTTELLVVCFPPNETATLGDARKDAALVTIATHRRLSFLAKPRATSLPH